MAIVTKSFGGNGGELFDIEAVKSVGVSAGRTIDRLILNRERHGGPGGVEMDTLEFHPTEFINRITIRTGDTVDNVTFHTNMGRSTGGGGRGGNPHELRNIRVLGLGGNSGRTLDKLRVQYIENYTDPSLIERNAVAIIDIVAPGESVERFVSTETSKLNAYTRMMETVFSAGISAQSSAIGKFIANITAKTDIKKTTKTEIKNEVKEIERNSEKTTFSPPQGHVGLEVVRVDVFRENDNFVWLLPVQEPQTIAVPQEVGLDASINAYDLTDLVETQIPSMRRRLETRNGYKYYRATNG
jgi:hypothetical protein